MSVLVIATFISAAGSLLGIVGGWILYANSAPENPVGIIPSISGDPQEYFQAQEEAIYRRQTASHRGFLILTLGAVLQLFGTVAAGFGG
jgi:hypothetical protein